MATQGMPYKGNPDFRGYLAAVAPGYLAFTGNDAGINESDLNGVIAQGLLHGVNANQAKETVGHLYDRYQQYQSGGGGDGGSSAQDAADKADEQAYWGDQINALNRLLDSTDTQKGQGLKSIDSSYDTSVNRTHEKENQGLRDYATKRDDTLHDKVSTFGNIDSQARNAYDSLMRVLGVGGAGKSSAAEIVAPQAVSRQATQQRTGATETFGRNIRDITTKEDDFKVQVAQALQDLLSEKKSKTEDFMRGIFSQKADINQQLSDAVTQREIAGGGSYRSASAARAPFQRDIGRIQNALDNIFNQYRVPTFAEHDINPAAPDLAEYMVDPIKVASQSANPSIDQSLLPYLASLKEKDNQPVLI